MKAHSILLAFAWSLILCPISLLAEDLKTYQATYEKQLEAIKQGHDAKWAALSVQYEKGLSALKARAQQEGSLPKIKGVVAEMERFKKEKAMPARASLSKLSEVRNLQTIFVKQEQRIETEEVKMVVTLTKQYARALANYQKTLVRSGKLDEALAVEAERKRVSNLIRSKLIIKTRTGNENYSGTNDLLIHAHIIGLGDSRLSLGKMDNINVEDRKKGQMDTYSLPFDYPVSNIRGVRLVVVKGTDAWRAETISFQFFDAEKRSKPYVFKVNQWFSAEKKDIESIGALKSKVFSFRPELK